MSVTEIELRDTTRRATISVRVPRPTRDAWMALPAETRRKVLAAFVEAVEREID